MTTTDASALRLRAIALAATLLAATGCKQDAPKVNVNVPGRCANVVCAASDACHVAGICSEDTGRCSNPPAANPLTVGPLSFTSPSPGVVHAGDLVELNAPAVTFGCGSVAPAEVTYRWAILQAPLGSSAVLSSVTADAPAFVPDVPSGHYQLSLTVTDTLGRDAPPAFLDLDVSACGANVPVVTVTGAPGAPVPAGALVTLSGLAADADQASGCPARFHGGTLAWSWSILSAPSGASGTLSAATSASTGFSATAPGSYAIVATATDGTGRAGSAVTDVAVSACGTGVPMMTGIASPVSRAPVGSSITLVASAWDSDLVAGGTCGATPATTGLQFQWRLVQAPLGSLLTVLPGYRSVPTLQLTPDLAGTFTIEATARDADGHVSAPMTVQVSTGPCGPTVPSITASPAPATVGAPVTLAPSTPPVDQCVAVPTLTSSWSLTSRPPGSAATFASPASGTFVPDLPGTYVAQLTVADQAGFSTNVSASVIVGACAGTPSAAIGAAYVAPAAGDGAFPRPFIGDRVDLTAAVTPSSCGVPASTAFTYGWALLSSPAGSHATLGPATGSTASFVPDVPGGTWEVAVTATDGLGSATTARRTITVSACGAQAPVAAIGNGPSATIATHGSIALSGSGSVDNTACPARLASSVADLSWSLVSGPPGASTRWSGHSGGAVTFIPDAPSDGTPYRIALTATGTNGVTSSPAWLDVTASDCGAQPPVPVDQFPARAFAARQNVGGMPVEYTGVGSFPLYLRHPIAVTANVVDPDGSAACAAFGLAPQSITLSWRLASVPAGSLAALSGADQLTAAFTPDLGGTYVLELTARDEIGAQSVTAFAIPVVGVCGGSAPAVSPPIASAIGPGFGNPVVLSAQVSDFDQMSCGLFETFAWSWRFTALPPGSGAVLLGPETATPSFVPDVAGSYQVAVTVTDSTGLASVGTVTFVEPTPAPLQLLSPVTTTQVVGLASGPATLLTGPFYQGFALQLAATVGDPSSGACEAAFPCTWGWNLVGAPAGSSALLAGATTATPSLRPDAAGSYTVRLTVTQGTRTLITDLAPIVVGACGGQAPVAVATPPSGPIAPGSIVQVDGSASAAPDATGCGLAQPLSYRWQIVALPAGSSAALNDPDAVNPSFTADLLGLYRLRLTVSDGVRTSATETAVTASRSWALPFKGRLHAATLDGSGRPVVAAYDPTVLGGRVQAWRCLAGCDTPASATWAQVGGDVDANVGVLTWTTGQEPRPVDVAVTALGQIVVAYKVLGTSTAGIGPCTVAVATFDGAAWSRIDAASSFQPLSGCSAGDATDGDFGRWLSLAPLPNGTLALASNITLYGTDFPGIGYCGTCSGTTQAASMNFSWFAAESAPYGGGAMGRLIQLLPTSTTVVRAAYQRAPGEAAYLELQTVGMSTVIATVPDANAGRYLRMADDAGAAVLGWYDPVARQPRLTRCSGASCVASWGVPAGAADAGRDLALSIRPGGATRVAFWNATDDVLDLASGAASAGPFNVTPLASGPSAISLVTTGGGVPLAIYTVGATNDLRVTTP
jgi:hypothetical protein